MSIQLAELLYPHVTETPEEVFNRFPVRQLPENAIVTRFAPSPTGFIHLGSIFISLIGRLITQQSKGVFILRIEDTDQERELEGGVEEIVSSLLNFGIKPDEGPFSVDPIQERGAYGPYQQTQRKNLYDVFAKHLVAAGLAYPSFQTAAELEAIHDAQEKAGVNFGYYGEWAEDRYLLFDEIKQKLDEQKDFALRYRAVYPTQQTIVVNDLIRGRLEMPAYDQDMILIKSDGLPTYHFAHVIDDALMRITLVLRADEWLSTLPIHVQLHQAIGQPLPIYAHIAPIGKIEVLEDGTQSKRKLSKRKDLEAAVSYYDQQGYPRQALLEYVLNIANSAFEDWRKNNPAKLFTEFEFNISKMSPSIALFDFDKLKSISRDLIATYSAEEVYAAVVTWSERYDPELASILVADPAYAIRIFNIGRGGSAPRKDLACWLDVKTTYGFFFDALYSKATEAGYVMPHLAAADTLRIVDHCIEVTGSLPEKEEWLQHMRVFSAEHGFAPNQKTFDKDPVAYKGLFSDVMMVYRVALANQHYTPDLYEVIQILGTQRVLARLQRTKTWVATKND